MALLWGGQIYNPDDKKPESKDTKTQPQTSGK